MASLKAPDASIRIMESLLDETSWIIIVSGLLIMAWFAFASVHSAATERLKPEFARC
jgi:hypothetical protein